MGLETLQRIDVHAGESVWALGGDLLDLDAAFGREHEKRLSRATVERHRKVVLALDVGGGLDPEAPDGVPADLEPEDLAGAVRRLLRRRRELDATGLPAAAGQHLGFYDDRPAELGRRLTCLLRREREPARRDGNPETCEQLLSLMLVEIQRIKSRRPAYPAAMPFADQLTLARIACAPLVVVLLSVNFTNHYYWGTAVFCIAMATDWFDGRVARRSGQTTSFGSLVDPVADKVLVLATLVVLLDAKVFPAWMVAAIVARELLVSGLRLAAIERGVVIAARDLGKLKTWSQAIAAAAGGLAAAGAWSTSVSWWLLLIAVTLTWVSGLDYARSAPSVLRGRAVASS